jgi:hypothetical protein
LPEPGRPIDGGYEIILVKKNPAFLLFVMVVRIANPSGGSWKDGK